MVIRPTDRVAEVLRQDERLLDTLVAISPVFESLRNPVLRRTMGRIATLEQAARVAGIEPEMLAERLNRAFREIAGADGSPPPEDLPVPVPPRVQAGDAAAMPEALAAIPPERVLQLDVREDLRAGREPFSRIMAARREMPAGGALRLRAIFEPVPLYTVLARQGLQHWTQQLAPDDWCVWFFHQNGATPAETAPASAPAPQAVPEETEAVVVLDVRGMEPPEPMVRTLAALESLPRGRTLLQINERVPQFLLPRLGELGFVWEVREQEEGVVRVFIRRRDEP